jgi:hypothetical protein
MDLVNAVRSHKIEEVKPVDRVAGKSPVATFHLDQNRPLARSPYGLVSIEKAARAVDECGNSGRGERVFSRGIIRGLRKEELL